MSVTSVSDIVSAKCVGCGRKAGPSNSVLSLYAEWYDLVPVRTASEDIGKAISDVIMKLADSGGFVSSGELISVSRDEAIGRKAVHILSDTGLIRPRYVVGDEEVTFDEAVDAKGEGKELKVCFRKSFSRER